MLQKQIELIGVYTVDNQPEVSLIELLINERANEIDLGSFTQEAEDEQRENWQAPFLEKYLSLDGSEVIGDDFDLPEQLTDKTRLTFFMYFLDYKKPLQTPYGELGLAAKIEPPQRIKNLIKFEAPE